MGFAERAQRGAVNPEALDFGQVRRALQPAQAGHRGIEKVQQQQQGIRVVKQIPIPRPSAIGSEGRFPTQIRTNGDSKPSSERYRKVRTQVPAREVESQMGLNRI
ncbi:hypothetical protein sS8_5109 [Methylocaldum marinum]|uniref:Uncharacterized protein n=1 Tax=Methylocaldum marinum TaxID=1432792 RepID=A0A250L167_9GAMM|nr:hypothetical protein sS8_5109 [Methylocaldum marinum]